MAWLSTILGRIRSHVLTLYGRGSSLRSQSSVSRLVDKKTNISSDPLAKSVRSPSSDAVVDSNAISSDPISDHFRSAGGLVNNRTNISSELVANNLRSLSDVLENKSIISSDPLAKSVRSPSSEGVVDSKVISSDPLAKVEMIQDDTFRPVETVQTGSLSHVVENKSTISSDPLAKSDSKVISSDPIATYYGDFLDKPKVSELYHNYMRSRSHVVENNNIISSDPLPKSVRSPSSNRVVDRKVISSDLLAKVELIPDDTFHPSDPFAKVELIPDDTFRPVETVQTGFYLHLCGGKLSEDIDFAFQTTNAFFKNVLDCEEHSDVIYKAFDVISNHSIFETCSINTKLKVLTTVFDRMQNYCQADASEVYLMNAFLKSMSNDDSKKDITKDEVISRVLNVIQSYPKVGHRKVTEATRFSKDFEFSPADFSTVCKALYLEFRLIVEDMANDEVSCKEISDFFYKNRMKRMEFEKFRARNISGHLFWRGDVLI